MWVAALLGGLAQVMGSLVGRVLLALGISYVSYSGLDLGIEWIKDQIVSGMTGMPATAANLLGFFWVDKAVSMIFSAFSASFALKTAGSSVIKKMVIK